LTVATLLVILPGIRDNLVVVRALQAARPSVDVDPRLDPRLDQFLVSVSRRIPSTARVLIAGSPPIVSFYRATYVLYPRSVLPVTRGSSDRTGSSLLWTRVKHDARTERAQYIIVWGLVRAPDGVMKPQVGAHSLWKSVP
jgi:hypothetical protein